MVALIAEACVAMDVCLCSYGCGFTCSGSYSHGYATSRFKKFWKNTRHFGGLVVIYKFKSKTSIKCTSGNLYFFWYVLFNIICKCRRNSMRKLNALHLKIIMAILMVLNHLEYIPGLYSSNFKFFVMIISRAVAPTFAFLVVEGIKHTRNLKKYLLRLAGFATITFIGNQILNSIIEYFVLSNGLETDRHMFANNDVLITLASGVFVIYAINLFMDKNKNFQKRVGYLFLAIVNVAIGIWGEWGVVLIPFMLLIYFFRDKKLLLFIGFVLIEIVALNISFAEPLYFVALPFIYLYNGERGLNNKFTKYFFYFFYPLHIWLIYIIRLVITIS